MIRIIPAHTLYHLRFIFAQIFLFRKKVGIVSYHNINFMSRLIVATTN